MKIELLESIASTNTYLKDFIGSGEDRIVCAKVQTGGRGTKGRSFCSDEGGVYLSALTFYEGLAAKDSFRVMTHAAVSVCRTAAKFGATPRIKWPNDVYVCGKKLCGILIENGISNGMLRWSIVGIGLNVSNDLSVLSGIAVNLNDVTEKKLTVEEVREELIFQLSQTDNLDDYLSFVDFLGQTVTVCEGDQTYSATAVSIEADGRLCIKQGDTIRLLSAAEVSLRVQGR